MEIFGTQSAVDEIMFERYKNPTWTYRQCAQEVFFNYAPMKIKQVNCEVVCMSCMHHHVMDNKLNWADFCACGSIKIPNNMIKVKNDIECYKIKLVHRWSFIDCDYPFHELESKQQMP
jgi:hypothetical protein